MSLNALTSPDVPAPAGAYSHIVEANGVVYAAASATKIRRPSRP